MGIKELIICYERMLDALNSLDNLTVEERDYILNRIDMNRKIKIMKNEKNKLAI